MTITTRTAIGFSITGRYLTLSFQFVSTMILARLLTPEEIGIFSAGFAIVALAQMFRDFGLNQYIIQEKELNETKIRTTFTLNLLMSWALGALLFFAAGLIADFFQEEGIETLIRILSFNFFIIPFGTITLALLRKKMRFHITAAIGLTASLLGICVSLATAYTGSGYLCLAYGAITETASIVLLSIFFRPRDVSLTPTLEGAKNIFRFGSIVGAGNVINQFATSITDALIARMLGLTQLGYFSRAFGTFSLFDHIFVNSIRGVILPLFSRDNIHTGRLRESYLKAVNYSYIFAWPFFTFLFLYTEETIRVLYGTQWDAAIPLVKILCLAGVLLPSFLFADNLFIAYGRPGITLKIKVISNVAKIIMVGGACFVGLKAVCLALVGFFIVRFMACQFYANQVFGIGMKDAAKPAMQGLMPLIFTIAPTLAVNSLMQGHIESIYVHFALLMAAAFVGWIVGLKLFRHAFYNEITSFAGKGRI
tara:strand:+ start:3803 stop:5242 length:1440 start_codon:yes stop_codon:yes gene_type:complete